MEIALFAILGALGLGVLLILGWLVYKIWEKWPSLHPVALGLKLIASAAIVGVVIAVFASFIRF